MPEIEKVDKGSPIGVNGPGQKRKQVYLLTIQYRDGTEKDVIMGSRRVAFVREGFLSKSNSDWMFYNTDGNFVATKSQKELGICSKIGSTGTDGGFYIFEKPDATLYEALQGKVKELYNIGDSNGGAILPNAVYEGYTVGNQI